MTDYAAWEKFDADGEAVKIEQDWNIEEVSDDLINSEKKIIESLEEMIRKIQNLSTALRSKVCLIFDNTSSVFGFYFRLLWKY
jgi:uncharacterized protein with von Willebrand factor type A (vWA) domain